MKIAAAITLLAIAGSTANIPLAMMLCGAGLGIGIFANRN
jgi:hypothetical protein